jgi:hypothetical protein
MSTKRPSASEQELDKVEAQFEAHKENIEQLTLDRMNTAPKLETEGPKIAQKDLVDSKDIYLKPHRTIGCQDKFNEHYRDQYNFDKEYVRFIAENNEVVGETIDIWTRPYGGLPAEWWKVPVNKALWGPRYLAEQIKRCSYHRLTMNQKMITSEDGAGQYTGGITVDTTINRLDARPVSTRKSVFMGANNF